MAFTARHYNEVARIIREAHQTFSGCGGGDDGAHAALYMVRENLRRMFAADNPRFDGTRFDMACEPRDESPKGGDK